MQSNDSAPLRRPRHGYVAGLARHLQLQHGLILWSVLMLMSCSHPPPLQPPPEVVRLSPPSELLQPRYCAAWSGVTNEDLLLWVHDCARVVESHNADKAALRKWAEVGAGI